MITRRAFGAALLLAAWPLAWLGAQAPAARPSGLLLWNQAVAEDSAGRLAEAVKTFDAAARAYAAEGLSADQARALSRSAAANARLAERLSRCGPAGAHKCKAGVRS